MISSLIQLLQGILAPIAKAVIGLFGVGIIIAVHEFGHFLLAKLFRVRTPSFSIGFGPQLFSRTIGETKFSLSAIPLGGYVELAGSYEPGQGEQKQAQDRKEGSFQHKPYWQKFLIMLGGIAFNILFAYVILSSLCFVGLPEHRALFPFMATPRITSVTPDSPAAQAGLSPDDTILSIDGTTAQSGRTILQALYSSSAPLTMNIEAADGQQRNIVIPAYENGQDPFRGIELASDNMCYAGFTRSLAGGLTITTAIIAATGNALINIFKTRDTKQLMGPIALIGQAGAEGSQGITRLLLFLAIVSINLALINLLPLPILDGGQILIYTIEAVIGRQLPLRAREILFIACWVLMLAMVIFMSYRDIYRIWNGRV